MRPATAVALMTGLVLVIGCQGRPKVQSAPAASTTRSAEPTTTTMEMPDADALLPGPSVPPPEQFVEVPRLQDIHFEYDAHEIRPEEASVLEGNAAWLKANPGVLVLIEGHTDERGTSEYNLGLGDLRASAAMRHLEAQGVPAARMVAISYGKERPLCTEHTESCWAKNRRAHFLAKPR
jgi:peptidoglycan-associated lipoprotein